MGTIKDRLAESRTCPHCGIQRVAFILFLSVRQSRLSGRIMFSTCPFVRSSVRLSVCSFVRLLPTCERCTSKSNEPISMQIGINLPPEQGHERSTLGVRRSQIKVTEDRSYVWKLNRDIILEVDPLSWIDRGVQWATEMLPLKGGVLHTVLVHPPPCVCRICVLLVWFV